MKARVAVIILMSVVLTGLILGCASIMHGSRQSISFQTNPVGATVEARDLAGISYGICDTPCKLELKRGKEYVVTFTKEGYELAEFTLEKKSDGWVWGNILFGGIIGLIIDFSNGAAYKISPDQMEITLNPESTGLIDLQDSGTQILVLDYDDLTPDEKARLKELALEAIPFTK